MRALPGGEVATGTDAQHWSRAGEGASSPLPSGEVASIRAGEGSGLSTLNPQPSTLNSPAGEGAGPSTLNPRLSTLPLLLHLLRPAELLLLCRHNAAILTAKLARLRLPNPPSLEATHVTSRQRPIVSFDDSPPNCIQPAAFHTPPSPLPRSPPAASLWHPFCTTYDSTPRRSDSPCCWL